MKYLEMSKIKYMMFAAVTGLIVISLWGCKKSKTWMEIEAENIEAYLGNHPDLNYTLKESGLYYLDELAGTGELAVAHDTAYIFYTGYLLDGTKFATNVGTTDTLIRPVNEGVSSSNICGKLRSVKQI